MAKMTTMEMALEVLKLFGKEEWTAAELAKHQLGTKGQIRSFLNDGKQYKVIVKVVNGGGSGKEPAVWRLSPQYIGKVEHT